MPSACQRTAASAPGKSAHRCCSRRGGGLYRLVADRAANAERIPERLVQFQKAGIRFAAEGFHHAGKESSGSGQGGNVEDLVIALAVRFETGDLARCHSIGCSRRVCGVGEHGALGLAQEFGVLRT